MFSGVVRSGIRDETGAVAATYAVALFGLVAIAGVAFDYGRLVAMDSELQNGADQAALAGASQLDGKTGACSRAATAASGLLTNVTVLGNTGNSNLIAIANETACDATGNIRFWQNSDGTNAATSDANAKFIEVTTDLRTARYALTPIVGAFGGTIAASAMAGLDSAICKVAPVMMCNPAAATDPLFTTSDYVGKGILLFQHSGGGTYGAGNFGWLSVAGAGGNNALKDALGLATLPYDCIKSDTVDTKPGQSASAFDALNSRFDIPGPNNPCGNSGVNCPPSNNSRKDVVLKNNNTGSCNWNLPKNPYHPSSATAPLSGTTLTNLSPMGYPRDMCHAINATGSCTKGRIGDGVWDRNAYFTSNPVNYPTVPTSGQMITMFGSTTPSRYAVYKYEAANAATRLLPQPDKAPNAADVARSQPACVTPGVPVGGTAADRRVFAMAVIDCTNNTVNGRSTDVPVTKWVDVFLVEPSLKRPPTGSGQYTNDTDLYVEVIGDTNLGGGGGSTTPQNVRHDVPYLVK